MPINSPKTVAEALKKYNLAPLKNLGQNFLIDGNIIEKIAGAAAPAGANIIEVGMGLAALTVKLAKRASRVVTVEVDKGLCSAANELLEGAPNVTLVEADILKVDLPEIIKANFGAEQFYACGNLPYYITAPVIMRFLEGEHNIAALTVMVQKEVAKKLAALPGNPDYGAITAACAYFGNVNYLFSVSRNCFYPKPKVDSALIRINMCGHQKVPYKKYSRVVKAAFSMKRKTLLNNLKPLLGEDTEKIIIQSGINLKSRPQEIGVQEFLEIAGHL